MEKPPVKPCDRQFRWLSSQTGDSEVLNTLNQQMCWFYSQQDGRQAYQQMLDQQETAPPPLDSVRHLMPKYICDLQPPAVLEVGCANGQLYRYLRHLGFTGAYSGLEVADYIIQQNRADHPEADWHCATAYQIPFPDAQFDLCFSQYVVEHLVFPEIGLQEMLRVVKPGGQLLLVFPDFVASGRLASQLLGFSPGSASAKLRQGKIWDALVSLYDSRFRLPQALRNLRRVGAFPVNTRPLCLSYPEFIEADVDGIYISSKEEVYAWAKQVGYQPDYPGGTQGDCREQAFLAIHKP